MNESFSLKNVRFNNRIFVASGTFGYGDEVAELVELGGLGGIMTKSLSLKPRDGNPPPELLKRQAGC